MNRRGLLQGAAVIIPFLSGVGRGCSDRHGVKAQSEPNPASGPATSMAIRGRLEPAKPGCRGRLVKVRSPLVACTAAPASPACAQVFKDLKNPYYLGDEIGLTQSLGWVDAWTSRPSVYGWPPGRLAIRRRRQFRREHGLRLVVKGGHSYQGTSNAADSC